MEASLCPEVVVTPTAWQWPAPLTQDKACLHMTAGAAQRVKTFVLCGYQRMAGLLLLTVVLCMGLCMIAECMRAVFLCFCLATFFLAWAVCVGTAGTNHSESCFFWGYSKSVTGAFAGADTDVSVAQARRWACVSGVLCL